jgi:dTDP-4-amino-4,6-dideoxygalactose transaminase
MEQIAFNKPYMVGRELSYIAEAHFKGMLAGDGTFTRRCQDWLQEQTGSHRALLTHSCTSSRVMR